MGGWGCVGVAWSYVGVEPSFSFCFAVAERGDVPLPRTAPPSMMEAHAHNNTLGLIFCIYAQDPTYFTLRAGFNFSSTRDYRKTLTELPRLRPIAHSLMPCHLLSLNHTQNLVAPVATSCCYVRTSDKHDKQSKAEIPDVRRHRRSLHTLLP